MSEDDCEGGGFSVEKPPPSRSLPKRRGGMEILGGEAASQREAPLPPDPSLPKSGWRLSWVFLLGWFRLRGGRVSNTLGWGPGGSQSPRDLLRFLGGRSFLKLHEKTADHADCAWSAVCLLRATAFFA